MVFRKAVCTSVMMAALGACQAPAISVEDPAGTALDAGLQDGGGRLVVRPDAGDTAALDAAFPDANIPDAAGQRDAGSGGDAAVVVVDSGMLAVDSGSAADAGAARDAAVVLAPDASAGRDAGQGTPRDSGAPDAQRPASCVGVVCGAHSSCVVGASPQCVCNTGYTGALCDACSTGYVRGVGGLCVEPVRLALPINPTMVSLPVIGFDNDPADSPLNSVCISYDGRSFPACYDQHEGTDFLLTGGFLTMDTGSTPVLAAADGVVVYIHDGEYDRCQVDVLQAAVVCETSVITPANRVVLQHADGQKTSYLHLKKNSIMVAVGDMVQCGDPLGLVGSSGNSSGPHVHLTLTTAAGVDIDPYAGARSHPETYWALQLGPSGLPGATCP